MVRWTMKPSRINLYIGIFLLAAGLAFGIVVWLEWQSLQPTLIFLALSLLPGVVQLSFYRHHCVRPRQPGEWQIWVPAMTILTLGVLLIDLVTWDFNYGVNHRYDHISIARVSEITGVGFPPGSRLERTTGVSFMHTILWANVQMRPGEVDSFLKALNKKHPIDVSHTKRLVASGMLDSPRDVKRGRFDWWQADSAKHFISAKTASPGGSSGAEIWLLIDQDTTERPVLYLSYSRD